MDASIRSAFWLGSVSALCLLLWICCSSEQQQTPFQERRRRLSFVVGEEWNNNPKLDEEKWKNQVVHFTTDAEAAPIPKGRKENQDDDFFTTYHIVVPTRCTEYDEWQSYMFFYQMMVSGFDGIVTRVATCETESEARFLIAQHAKIVQSTLSDRFRLHLAPDYQRRFDAREYEWLYRSWGIRHWMRHALGFPHNQNPDVIVIVMDLTQWLLRPLANSSTTFLGNRHVLAASPAYEYREEWMKYIDLNQLLQTSTTLQTPHPSGLLDWMHLKKPHHSKEQRPAVLALQTPYAATAANMWNLVVTWADFVLVVQHQTDQDHYSDAIAFAAAAAHWRLYMPHTDTTAVPPAMNILAPQYHPWPSWLDSKSSQEVCSLDLLSPNVTSSSSDHADVDMFQVVRETRFYSGPFFWSRFRMPVDFFWNCSHPLFQEPPDTIANDYQEAITPSGERQLLLDPQLRLINALGLCQTLPRLNMAATFYKQHHCSNSKKTNFNQTFVLGKPTKPIENSKERIKNAKERMKQLQESTATVLNEEVQRRQQNIDG